MHNYANRKFEVIDSVILKTEHLKDGPKILYLALSSYAFDNIKCFPSQETLKDFLGGTKDTRTIRRHLSELRKVGLVKTFQPSTNSSNRYVLIPPELSNLGGPDLIKDDWALDSKEELDDLVEEINNYYLEVSGKVNAEYLTEKEKKPTVSQRRTFEDWQEESKVLYENDSFDNWKPQHYLGFFALKSQEILKIKYTADFGRDLAIITDVFIKPSNIETEEACKIIEKFVEVYDIYFKNGKYKYPKIYQLRLDWIFNKVVNLVIKDVEEEQEEEVLDISF